MKDKQAMQPSLGTMKSLKINYLFNLLLTVSNIIFPIITYPYAARVMGANALGLVNFANSFLTYFIILSSLGVPVYGLREIAKIRNNKFELSKLYSELMSISAILSVASSVLYFIIVYLFSTFTKNQFLHGILGISIILNLFSIDWFFTGLEEFKFIAIRGIIIRLLSLILLITLVKKSEDYIIYAALGLLASALANIFNFIISMKYVKYQFNNLNLLKHVKPIVLYSILAITINMYFNLGITLLGFLSKNEQVANFTVAFRLILLSLTFISSATYTVMPRVSYYLNNDMGDAFIEVFSKVLKFFGMIAFPLALAIFLLSEQFIYIFVGKEFITAGRCFQVLAPVVIISGLSNLVGNNFLLPSRGERQVLYSALAGLTINIIANTIFIPIYGSIGAAISYLLAELTILCYQIVILQKHHSSIFKLIFYEIRYTHYIASSVIVGLFIIVLKIVMHSQFLIMILSLVICPVIYLIMLMYFEDAILNDLLIKFKNIAFGESNASN